MAEFPGGPPLPVSRYGRAPLSAATRRRIVVALGAAVVLVTLAVAVLGYQRFVAVDVEGSTAAYQVLDDRAVSITISVTRKDPSRPAVCIVRALASDGAETGRREIMVAPSQAKTVQIDTTVVSYRRPFMADIYGCGMTVPSYLAPAQP